MGNAVGAHHQAQRGSPVGLRCFPWDARRRPGELQALPRDFQGGKTEESAWFGKNKHRKRGIGNPRGPVLHKAMLARPCVR